MQQLIAKPSLLIFVVIYVIMLVAVGAYYSRKAKTSDEFVRAGGGLGSIVLMGTFLATFTGNGTISGGGNSLAFTYGLWPGIFFAIPSLAGVIVLFLLAGKIRQSDSFTVAGLLENKYGHTARTLSGIIIALSMISICAYQYKGLAYVLNVTTGMDVNIATALSDYRLNREEKQMLSLPDLDFRDHDGMFNRMVQSLAEFSGCTVFALSPVGRDGCFAFEIMPVGENAVILAVASDRTVHTCFCKMQKRPLPEECEVLTKIFNRVLSGFSAEKIGDVRLLLLEHEVAARLPHLKDICAGARKLAGDLKTYTLHIGGSTNLLSYPEFANIETARAYIGILDRHEQIVEALRKDFYQGNITIKIGRENLVFDSPYASMIEIVPGGTLPVMLGVMGPTRMDYSRIIAGCNHLIAYINDILEEY